MPNLGMGELLIILVICLLVFGAGRLPQIGEGIGKAIKNLKRGLNTDDDIDVTPRDRQVSNRSSASSARDEVEDAEVDRKP
ncbi:MAG: twin-arginine translocase TatA/TatE family subunit [Polyangiales bacterium]